MIERTIYLEGIDPMYLYGANNVLLNKIKGAFPKLKIIARGHEIITIGDKNEINSFVSKVEEITDHYNKYNHLTDSDLETILQNYSEQKPAQSKDEEGVILYGNHGKQIKARTINQQRLVDDYEENDLIFALGPAGTGKTYTAIALAVRSLKNREVKRIILTRPAVEAGENLGFLPGDLKEKLDPYLQPLYDALNDMIPGKKLETYIEENIIEIAPLAYMRGRTLDNAVVILDEGQNTTVNQLKMFLTRMGKNAKFIVTGDTTQIDLPRKTDSGLVKAIEILKTIEGMSVIHFDARDVVRHKLVTQIIEAYNKYDEREKRIKGSS
jgi:phosphate starvation-inducible PhoH-like protein